MFEKHSLPFFSSRALYDLVELYRQSRAPLHEMMDRNLDFLSATCQNMGWTGLGPSAVRNLHSLNDLAMMQEKPQFGITSTKVDGHNVGIRQRTVESRPFCSLVHFKKRRPDIQQPKLLIVAPMSGHYSTLLRGTVEGLLPFADVYVTDWQNARDVPFSKGAFDLDDYIMYTIDFIRLLGPDVHVFAVCQPAVPVLAAVAVMSAEKDLQAPSSMILMGGPIDARQSPTTMNDLATTQSEKWFTENVITMVPANYPGTMRPVYPGFLQLMGFLAMNLPRHLESGGKLYRNIATGNEKDTETIHGFYKEYFSVMDLTAEFYLQTMNLVFKEFALPEGKMMWRGRAVDPEAIEKTGLLVIEGEKDDIAGIGQTHAAIELCHNISARSRQYHLQKDVGHYGLFSGSRYRKDVVPVIMDFIQRHNKSKAKTAKAS